MAGRKPVPTKLKLLRGNPGKRPLNDSEPQPAEVTKPPRAPQYLDDIARREWRRVIRYLVNSRVLTHVDLAAIEAYCQAYARWRQAEARVGAEGAVTETTNGNLIQSPWVSIANTSQREMRSWMTEMGMTASSRSRVKTVGAAEEDDSLAAQLERAIGQ